MRTIAFPARRPGTAKSGPFLGSMVRIRSWFPGGSRYETIQRRVDRLESASRQQVSAYAHEIEIARSLEEKIARTEEDRDEIAEMQARLAKLESASRQQMSAHAHAIEIARSLEEKITYTGENEHEIVAIRRQLAKHEAAWRQQIYLHSHAIAIEDRLAAFEASWQQHVPTFLNAIASVGGFGYELSRTKKQLTEVYNSFRSQLELLNRIQDEISKTASRFPSEIKGLQDKTRKIGEEVRHLRDKAGNVDIEFSKIWEAGSRYHRELSDLWHRIEFIRREILFEFSHSVQAERSASVVTRILDPAKVEAAQRASCLRVNLGCGHIALHEYVNIDQRELPGVDIVTEVGNLPFKKGSIDEIVSAHLLEHFPQEELQRRLLPYWFSLLKPGKIFRAVVPDGDAMVTMLAGGNYSFEDFRSVLFGGQDYDGDFHYNLFTPNSLAKLLERAGFTEVEIPVKGRANGQCFEFEIHARRPLLADIEATVHDG